MLAKKERLTTSDFSKAKTLKSKKLITKYGFFVILEAENTTLFGKKGITLPKKVFKTAVSRNLHKRLFYNCVKEVKGLKEKSFILHSKGIFTKEDLQNDLLKL